ncbi:patatin-like phospholipase family protein [Cupriavidus necator]|uniref:patatin-like phospholipase family protein n=1 Tax=Cupriavidus necator TaxID=106590 RepID=UPI0005B44C67|nr:patatin-like phospholipase family protein [Cupriavidus necator]
MEKTAFVFAGGGSLGAIQVGMLRELVAWGVMPDIVIGASAGAINGAYFACNPGVAGAGRLDELWRGIRRSDIMPWSWRSVWSMVGGNRGHLVESAGLRGLLTRHFGPRRLEAAELPLHVVATDMQSGAEVLLSSGSIVDAVLASAAIPGVFPPVQFEGRTLIDGGVANNTPVSTAIALGATRVIVLPAGFTCAERRPPRGALEHAFNALSLLVARQLVNDLQHFAERAHISVVPPLCPLDISPYDYSKCGELIDRAAATTGQWLKAKGLDSRHVPGALHVHSHDDGAPSCSADIPAAAPH